MRAADIRAAEPVSFDMPLLHHFERTECIFHETNQMEMWQAVIPVGYFSNERFTLIEIPFQDKKHVLGIILSQDWKTMDIVDYGPNNVPKLLCGELKTMIRNMKKQIVHVTIPLFSQSRDDVSLVLRNGKVNSYRNAFERKVRANRVFLFYVRSEDGILLVGDYQGVD